MSTEYTAPTAPATFYLQYHVEGSSGGAWNASTTPTSDKFQQFDKWVIQPGGSYLLSAYAKQGSGNADYVFAAFTFDGANYWGVRLPPDGSYVQVGTGALEAPNKEGVQLTARAGNLVSGDPQVQVGGLAGFPSTTSITWWGKDKGGWKYDDNTPVENDTVKLSLDSTGKAFLTVADATEESNAVALYQRDGTIYEQPKDLTEPRYAATYTITDEGTYTVNVFNDSGDAKTKG